MKKLKKSSKNSKPKFKVVMFYGPFAVGKYTVAKEFHKQTGYKFFHNHHTYNLVRELFERDTFNLAHLIESICFSLFSEIANARINVVTTHAYSSGFISKTGQSDPDYMKNIESIIEKAGGIIYFVHLTADPNILLKRVTEGSRKKLNKLTDPKIMREIIKQRQYKKEWTTPAPVKNNIEIDNSNLNPKQVVKTVLEMIEI